MAAITKMMVSLALNGFSGWQVLTIEQILGKPAEEVRLEDLRGLSRRQVLDLFHATDAPEFKKIKGEYKAEVLPVGPFAGVASFYTHRLFGPGRWEGKAFFPFSDRSGWGYNIFSVNKKNRETPARTCKMNTYHGLSNIDDKSSLHLDYAAHNGFLNHTMHDEIRRINDELYIGMGYMSVGGGPTNPAPFALYGKPSKWVGPDKG
jgi:hypothetical protein